MRIRIGSADHGTFQLISHYQDPNCVTKSVARSALVAKNPLFSAGFHPGEAGHVMKRYRATILGLKRSWGTARGHMKYRGMLDCYLRAKKEYLRDTPC